MEKTTLQIPNISCGHCVAAVKNELSEMAGVSRVEGNPDTKQVEVEWQAPATLEAIRAALDEINYPAGA